jgi:hypothetical protein
MPFPPGHVEQADHVSRPADPAAPSAFARLSRGHVASSAPFSRYPPMRHLDLNGPAGESRSFCANRLSSH